MTASDRVEPPFVGESRYKIVDGLIGLLTDVQYNERALWVSIEAPSGWGKTRVAHAFYERIAARQERRYWPATILESTDATLHDVASRRKRVFPEPISTLQGREAGALPEFFWWGIACDLRNGVATQVLQQDLEQLEAHSLFLEAAWSALASVDEKHGISLDKAQELVRKLAEEATGAGLDFLAAKLLGASLPGLGLAVDLAKFGFNKARASVQERQIVAQAGGMPNEAKSDIVDDAANTLIRLARPGLPVIIFIEDIHRDNGLVGRLLDRLVRANAPILILTTTWPGEIERSQRLAPLLDDPFIGDRIYRLHHDRTVPDVFPQGASMDALPQEALREIIRSYYPATSDEVLDRLSARYNNPLPIEIICSLPKHRNRSRDGALVLSAEEIDQLPRQVSDLYRQLWNELDYPVQCALALSTLAIPESDAAWHRELVGKALAGVAEQIARPASGSATADDVPHGWVREMETWLRRFNEPDQMRIAREDLEDETLFGQEVIAPFLETLVAEIARPELWDWEQDTLPTNEAQHRAWLALALRSTGRIDDDLALQAILLLLNALADKPLEIPQRLSLGGVFQELDASTDSLSALSVRAHLARTLGEAGRVEAAIAALETLLEDQKRVLGENHPDVLTTRNDLAFWLDQVGQVEKAILALETLLADRQRVLGVNHPDVFGTRNSLACFLRHAGRVEEAITAFQMLLADQLRVLGEDHPSILLTCNNLASSLGSAGRVEEAITAFQMLLADQLPVLGEDHPYILKMQSNLAFWLGEVGRVEEAITAFEALLANQQRVLGKSHPDVLRTSSNLASCLGQAGRVAEAVLAFEGLLADQQRVMNEDHPDILGTRNNLAFWLGKAGRPGEAIAAFKALLVDEQRVLGDNHPKVLKTRNNLALCLGEVGRLEEAITAFEALLANQQRVLGENHPDVLKTRHNLAFWLGKAGRVEETLLALLDLLADQQRVLGVNHPDVLGTRNNLAFWLGRAGRVKEAITAFGALLAVQQRVLGENHSNVLTTRHNLALMFGRAGRLEEAITAFEVLLVDRQRIQGLNHPDVFKNRNNLAFLFGEAGRAEEAIAAFETLLADQQRVLGEDHPDVLTTRSNLAHWLGKADE